MKKVVLIILGISMGLGLIAQGDASKAFLDSYFHEANEEYSEAIKDMESEYTEGSYSINLRLGWLYYLDGDYYKSITYYKKAIQNEPRSIEARLGYVYPVSALENWEDVLNMYKEILDIDPNNTAVNYNVAYMYYLRGDWVNAEAGLIKVLELYPFDYDSSLLLGSVYVKMGMIKEAREYYIRALQYSPSSSEIRQLLKAL